MKTLIISSSLSKNSKSLVMCMKVKSILTKMKINVEIFDVKKITLNPYHTNKSSGMEDLANKISEADNYIIAMGVHNYTINDSLKIVLDNCFHNVDGKFFGIICAAGGEKSYLSTIHLSQICMNQWKMIQLPRVLYATHNDFKNNEIISKNIIDWIDKFCEEFCLIGKKLIS